MVIGSSMGMGGCMVPPEDFYAGLSLSEQLRRFAEHHYEQATRHISRYEYEMLLHAAELLQDHYPTVGGTGQGSSIR